MEVSNPRNMIVLKNLPSNIVDEAIIILKTNKKVKKLEKVEQKKNKTSDNNKKNNKEYILKGAEMIVNNYISKIEKSNNKNESDKQVIKKYGNVKKYSIFITIMSILQTIIIICR